MLPDGKSNKGRVQAYDGPIYVADAALYLMKKKPDLWISTSGHDGNPGTQDRPFASIARGRDAARELHASRQGKPVTVVVRGGSGLAPPMS